MPLTIQESMEMIERLIAAGVNRFDIGMPNDAEIGEADIVKLCESYSDSSFYMYVKSSKKSVDTAARCNASGIVLNAALGYPNLRYQLRQTWEDSLEKSLELISYANEKKLPVILEPFDLTRSRPEDIDNYIKAIAKNTKIDGFRINDMAGCALPQAIQYLVSKAQKTLKDIPIQVCVSNDFGMALSSTLCAIMSGAQTACTAVNGLAARNGIAATEEVISCLVILLGCDQYMLDMLYELSILSEQLTGIDVAATKPFTGRKNYYIPEAYYDSASHHSLYWFATEPEVFGRKIQPMKTHHKK
jgi:isopropylmalate/homocitrate/citramalate synthase